MGGGEGVTKLLQNSCAVQLDPQRVEINGAHIFDDTINNMSHI